MQRFKCLHCGKSFAEKTPLDGLRVPVEKVVQTIQLLCEGMGIRAISRFTGLRQKTVLSILEMAGQKAARLLDEQIRNVEVESVQCDEIFSFVGCKECNNKLKDPEHGTQYTFLAIDRKSKLIMSHYIGKPERALISTSHVERTNLSVRLFNRRFTRLTLGYSKKLANLKHSVALFIAHFNFCRVHSAHKQTPAMHAELTNHVWTIEELIGT